MRHFVYGAAAFLAGLALTNSVATTPAHAENAVVVELYTSQGCSSCPPADALLHSLSGRNDLIPLALHVDYWDYIGWEDTFADSRFTDRQYAYAKHNGASMVYTPQMIVQGGPALTSANRTQLDRAIAGAEKSSVAITVRRVDGGVAITANAANAGPAFVQLVRYRPQETVTITRGENAGEVITYSNIVTEWNRLGDWSGQGTYEVTVPLTGPDAAVVIVQTRGPGPILAAYRVE